VRLWSGRFGQDIIAQTLDYTHTTDVDRRLVQVELWASMAHVLMLCRRGIIPENDGRALLAGLKAMLQEWEQGTFQLDKALEDVHLNVETELIKRLGAEVGGKVHTARSRNDQVVTDARLYVREQLIGLGRDLAGFALDLCHAARGHVNSLTLGYTHSQPAQPVSFAFWLTGYASLFRRDLIRLSHAYSTVNQNPLGACALAGTSFPIDRALTTELLGFDSLLVHALDATSARDFLLETASALAILMGHVSRFCEEIVVGSTFEFGIFEVEDRFATGSSIMPQKKNPVVAELARARAGIAYSALLELLTVVKAVPLGYSSDLQQDKPPLWRALDATASTISILRAQTAGMHFHHDRAARACWDSFCTATELANHLVRALGMPFRQAHHVIGALVRRLTDEEQTLSNTARVCEILAESGINLAEGEVQKLVDPSEVLRRQQSQGGTAPERVSETISALEGEFRILNSAWDERAHRLEHALERTLSVVNKYVGGESLPSLLPSDGL
jgi:argininosuccinate lyase